MHCASLKSFVFFAVVLGQRNLPKSLGETEFISLTYSLPPIFPTNLLEMKVCASSNINRPLMAEISDISRGMSILSITAEEFNSWKQEHIVFAEETPPGAMGFVVPLLFSSGRLKPIS